MPILFVKVTCRLENQADPNPIEVGSIRHNAADTHELYLTDSPLSSRNGGKDQSIAFYFSSPMDMCASSYKNSSNQVDLISPYCTLLSLAAAGSTLFRQVVALLRTLSPILKKL